MEVILLFQDKLMKESVQVKPPYCYRIISLGGNLEVDCFLMTLNSFKIKVCTAVTDPGRDGKKGAS